MDQYAAAANSPMHESYGVFWEQQIEEVDKQIQEKIGGFQFSASYGLLQTVTGIKAEAAATFFDVTG